MLIFWNRQHYRCIILYLCQAWPFVLQVSKHERPFLGEMVGQIKPSWNVMSNRENLTPCNPKTLFEEPIS